MNNEHEQVLSGESDLVQRLQLCDHKAFREFVGCYQRRLYTLAYNLTGNHYDAEDLVQEVFIKAYSAIRTFQGQSKLYTWLHRMTVNAFLDHKRTKSHRLRVATETLQDYHGVSTAERPDEHTGNRLTDEQLQRALVKLSPQQKAVFVLRYYQEASLQEIAETLAVTEGTVKTLLFRATRQLRESLKFFSE